MREQAWKRVNQANGDEVRPEQPVELSIGEVQRAEMPRVEAPRFEAPRNEAPRAEAPIA